MSDYMVADKSYNRDTGELEQFLILWESGEPETRRATPENMLLFDPENELDAIEEGGLFEFLQGGNRLMLSQSDPRLVVAQSGDEYSYIIKLGNQFVETTPEKSAEVLEGVYQAVKTEGENLSKIRRVHAEIMSTQVRRGVVNALKKTFPKKDRIDVIENGWLVDGFFLVDWSAKMYAANDDTDEGDYVRDGSEAVKKDTTHEFVRVKTRFNLDNPLEVTIGGDIYELTEREMLFLAKVKWLLNRRHYHPDDPFWMYVDRWSDVDWKSGEPADDEGYPDDYSW